MASRKRRREAENRPGQNRWLPFLLIAIPILCALFVWLTPLCFVPVPWPDDSAFYFVGKELFKWPPRWVMIPQAPFEPTYRIFNFNTMPLYPFLVGLGRLVGIDGSFLIKIWPLSAWAASGSLLVYTLFRAGLPALGALLLACVFGMDPELRWASVLVRPESVIALCGMALVLGMSLGFPKRFEARGKFWDPIAACLAIAAYAHFNAIHLLFAVVLGLLFQPKKLVSVGLKTALYLSPWALVVLMHFSLFLHQMATQWNRLAVRNDWLDSPLRAVSGLFQSMGSPIAFVPEVQLAGVAIWLLIFCALGGAIYLVAKKISRHRGVQAAEPAAMTDDLNLLPAAGWVIGAVWLWDRKPEVWFVYYIHAAVWCFGGLLALKLHRLARARQGARGWSYAMQALFLFCASIFAYADYTQLDALSIDPSWTWNTYHEFIDCIDRRLTSFQKRLGLSDQDKMTVWDPTFPDVTIELSRRHPNWELTRTNDFWDRQDLAIQHGKTVDAVVVPESVGYMSRNIEAPMSEHPEIQSVWMTWSGYFLIRLWKDPEFKPKERYLCQRGRWQAFIFGK